MKGISIALFALFGFTSALAVEVPLVDFARLAQYRDVKISPEGDYLAANAVVKDKAVLSLVRLSDFKGSNVGAYEDSEVQAFWWVGPHQVMYTVGERSAWHDAPLSTGELFVVDADGGHDKPLYGGARVSGYDAAELIAALPDDPQHALISRNHYFGNASLDTTAEALRIDLGSGRTQSLGEAPLRNADFLADNAGNVRIAWGVGTDWQNKVYYRADASAPWKMIFGAPGDHGFFSPLMFDRDGKNLYAHCDGAHGVGGICRWNVATQESKTLWSGTESGPLQLLRTPDAQDAFAVSSMPGRPKVALFDTGSPDAKLLSDLYHTFQGQNVTLGTSTRDGGKRIIYVDSDINPGDFYLYDRNKKSVVKLLSRMPWIKPEQMAAMQPIELKARDDLSLHGYLTRPLGKEEAKNLPLVVLVHGGPYGERDKWEFDPEVQMLASRGYAVLQVNFRGSGGYGADFQTAGYREWGGKMQDDVTDATHWAIKEGVADPARVCIFGGSYGGYAALEGAVKEPDLYACAIGAVGVYDLNAWTRSTDVRQSKQGKSYMSQVLGNDENELRERSPIAHLDKLKAKVMLIVGGADRRVPPSQGRGLHEALDDKKIAHEWVYHLNEGHGYYKVEHRTDMYEKILAFLDRNIGTRGTASATK